MNNIKSLIKENNGIIISYPSYYNKNQINYIKELYKIINLNVIESIPEYISLCSCYGYENNNRYNENEEYLMILLDIGYINGSITFCKYRKNKCEILNHIYDKELSGRNIDNLIIKKKKEEIEKEIEDKLSNKAYIKLKLEMIKLKEKLSANGADEVRGSIENGDDDIDIDYNVTELNEILINNGLIDKLKNLLNKSIKESNISKEEYNKINIVICGGSLRIPLFQNEIEKYMKEELKIKDNRITRTLNMDECISLGNCYYKLMKDKKWNYKIIDNENMNVNVNNNNEISNELFNKLNKLKESFELINGDDIIIKKLSEKRNEVEEEMYKYNINK